MDPRNLASIRERLAETFWERHSNPKSGWSRMLLGPLFILAAYRRDWRLFTLAVVATIVNPVLFPRPDPDTESWMTRGVRAERWWLTQGNGTIGFTWPNLLNTLNLPVFTYSLYAAYARKPIRSIVGLAVSVGLKLGWIALIARRYDRSPETDRFVKVESGS